MCDGPSPSSLGKEGATWGDPGGDRGSPLLPPPGGVFAGRQTEGRNSFGVWGSLRGQKTSFRPPFLRFKKWRATRAVRVLEMGPSYGGTPVVCRPPREMNLRTSSFGEGGPHGRIAGMASNRVRMVATSEGPALPGPSRRAPDANLEILKPPGKPETFPDCGRGRRSSVRTARLAIRGGEVASGLPEWHSG